MIKELIRDIAFDKITVAQALTRAKLIAHLIKNDIFKSWLNKELNGYEFEDPMLPDYRKIWAEIHLTAEFPFGRTQTFPVLLPDSRQDIEDLLNYHRVIEPISIVEQNMEQLTEGKGYINLTGGQVQLVGELYKDQVQRHNGVIRSGQRTIGKSQLANIVELTKQKLIDTLQDLEEQFPEIDNKYIMNEENDRKAQNIITNNIYGNNNPLNVAAGDNIKQGDINLTINEAQYEHLRELGVQEPELQELKVLDDVTPKGNPDRKGKIMGWLGKVTASMTSRGIYDSIPKLVEYVGNII
jgi:molybdopterin converting factor small subunit